MKKYKGKNIRVSDEFHEDLKKYVAPIYKINVFVENAVREKIKELKLKPEQINNDDNKLNRGGICLYYQADNTTAMNCRYCGKSKLFHLSHHYQMQYNDVP